MHTTFNRVLISIYRACYVLLTLKFTGRVYHKLFPKLDYDYGHAKMYIIAYYPEDGQGLLVFKSTTICPEMLEWFREFRDRLQSMLRRGKVKLVTEAVPLGEVQLGADAMTVMGKIRFDLASKYSSDDLARLLTESSVSYAAIQEKYASAK
jgi:hypothetical protein